MTPEVYAFIRAQVVPAMHDANLATRRIARRAIHELDAAQEGASAGPVWVEGEPANIEAAAADGWQWMETLRGYDVIGKISGLPAANRDQGRANLARCCNALARFLRALPPGVNRSRPSDTAAVLVASNHPGEARRSDAEAEEWAEMGETS